MGCGGWNRTNDLLGQSQVLRTSSNHPAVLSMNRESGTAKASGRRIRTGHRREERWSACFKGRSRRAGISGSPRVPCGNRTHLASLEGWRLCRSAKGTCCFKAEGEGVEPSRLIARRFSKPLPSPIGLPFRKAAATGIEPVICSLTGSRLTIRPRRNAVSVVRFELTISCSQGRRIPRLSYTLHKALGGT